MEELRRIIREELLKIRIFGEAKKKPKPSAAQAYFNDPEKMHDLAMEWMDKAHKLQHFHQLVGATLDNMDSPEEKLEELMFLWKEFLTSY